MYILLIYTIENSSLFIFYTSTAIAEEGKTNTHTTYIPKYINYILPNFTHMNNIIIFLHRDYHTIEFIILHIINVVLKHSFIFILSLKMLQMLQ